MSYDGPVLRNGHTVDLIAISRIFWSYKYWLIAVVVLFVLAATALAFTATEIYRAEVVVTPARETGMRDMGSLSSRLSGLASLAGLSLGSAAGPGQEARAVLRSRRLVEEFIARNNLVVQLFPKPEANQTAWLAVKRFRETVLSIEEDEDNGTITVAIEWVDPAVAATWANDFVALANELMRTRALQEASRNIEYLNEQISRTNVVEVQRVMYNLIEAETQTLMLANGRAEYAFTVVDPAVAPEMRARPKRKLTVLAGGLLGVLIGGIGVLVHNAFRQHRPRHVQ